MFFEHVVWADDLEKIMLACGVGRRGRGQPRKRGLGGLMAGEGIGLRELRKVVRNRRAWRTLTMTVARIQQIDGTRMNRWNNKGRGKRTPKYLNKRVEI